MNTRFNNHLIDNRQVRIFLSSTFSDMQKERDALIQMFETLKVEAAKRIMGTGTFIHTIFPKASQRQLERLTGSNSIMLVKANKRYLWLATHMGMPTVTKWPRSSSALRAPLELVPPGIEIVQTYNQLNQK